VKDLGVCPPRRQTRVIALCVHLVRLLSVV
jgi:hypothetical protein